MKLRLDRKGLSPLVAVIVLLTLVMVLGAIIAGTLSGAPRPVLPATTAVNLMTPYGGNPAAGDNVLIIRHEYGAVIDDAWTAGVKEFGETENYIVWHEMELLVNGEVVQPVFISGTSNGAEAKAPEIFPGFTMTIESLEAFADLEPPGGGSLCFDFAVGDQIEIELDENLESSDLIQLVYVSRDLMLVEYLVQ